jgi:preprotein translocase subunit Sss1
MLLLLQIEVVLLLQFMEHCVRGLRGAVGPTSNYFWLVAGLGILLLGLVGDSFAFKKTIARGESGTPFAPPKGLQFLREEPVAAEFETMSTI